MSGTRVVREPQVTTERVLGLLGYCGGSWRAASSNRLQANRQRAGGLPDASLHTRLNQGNDQL